MKKTSSLKKLTSTLLLLLPSIDIKRSSSVLSFVFFPSGCGIKQLFEKTFDLDYWPLASDCSGKKVDLSFAGCQYFQAIKTNRAVAIRAIEQ